MKNLAEQLSELESTIKQQQKKLSKANAELESLKPKDIEVVFVLDTTGSMREEINSIKEHLSDVVNTLRLVNKKTRMGFVAYRDEREDAGRRNSYITKVHPMREMTPNNLRSLIRFVDGLSAGGGGPNPAESLSLGLQEAIRMPWSKGESKHIIVAITDASANDETKAKRLAQQFTRNSKSSISSKVSTILATPRDTKNAAPFLKQLAKAGNGEFSQDSGRMISSLLKATLTP